MGHPVGLRCRLAAAATALGSAAVVLVLLAGFPYVLWRAAGVPWPDAVASWSELADRLMQPISDPLMVDLLAVVGWVAWAGFALSAVRETIWYAAHLPELLRDRRAHDAHVATLSLKESLAAVCVGALVVALLSLWRPQVSTAQQPVTTGEMRPATVATGPVNPGQDHQVSSAGRQPLVQKGTAGGTGVVIPRAVTESMEVRHVEYVVESGDTLWEIAHARLGDGCKWPRIYALSKHHIQPDGGRLGDPDRIMPGWRLTIPVPRASAAPSAPAPDSDAPGSAAPPESAAPHEPPKDVGGDGDESERHAGREDSPEHRRDGANPETESRSAQIGLGEAGLIGITAAAGLLMARHAWRLHQARRRQPDQEDEEASLSPFVELAAQAAHEASLPVRQDDPEALITRRTPPRPPRAPGTVTIGLRDEVEVGLAELAAAGGVALLGPGAEAAARALLVGILTAAERCRPGRPHVTAVVPQPLAELLLPGLPTQFTALTQGRDLTHAVRLAEQHLITHGRHEYLENTDAPPVESAASTSSGSLVLDAGDFGRPGTLVLLATPDAAHTGQLRTLAAQSRPDALMVFTLDTALPGASRWHVDPDGTTDTAAGQGPGPLRLFHLTPDAGRDMVDVLLGAHGQRPHPRATGHQPTRTVADQEENPAAQRTPPARDARPPHVAAEHPNAVHHREAQHKPVRLNVLGPITLHAHGNPDPIGANLRSEVHEFLALLAAHPAGLLASDIAEKLHLADGTEQNALKNLRRAVRRSLRPATGIDGQEFVLLQGEVHKLHPQLVETDLADFTELLRRPARRSLSADEEGEEYSTRLDVVSQALVHYRGPFAQGCDYLWADTIREHATAQAADAVLRLAHQTEHVGDSDARDTVLALLERLGTLHPEHEQLTQHTMRLYQQAGHHDAARSTYARLQRRLAELGLEPAAATQALLTPALRQPR